MKFESRVPSTNPLVENLLFKNHFLEQEVDQPISVHQNSWIKIDLLFIETLSALEMKYLDEVNTHLLDCKELINAINTF